MKKLPVLAKLEKDLEESRKELNVDIPKALKIAMDHGDLSENAEFKAAKDRQSFLESRVSQLQKRISDILSIDLSRIPKDRSGLGSVLHLEDLDTGEKKIFHLVFPEEVDPDAGKISGASPVGRSLINKQEGDEVVMALPSGKREYEILKVITIHDLPDE